MRHLLFTSILLSFAVIPLFISCSETPQPPIQALLITGGGWHDYDTQDSLLINGINERIGDEIVWTIVHEGDGEPDHHVSIFQQPNWADGYDVIVHNTGFGRVTDPEFVAHIVESHIGTPAVLIHAAIHSYRYAEPADPWFEFMGLQSMWHESQRPFEVETIDPIHPIMRNIPESWTTPDDEVYVVEEIWGDITTLAETFGVETEEYHPVAWAHYYEDTRVFATSLGHNNDMFHREEFLNMVSNGLLWAADRLDHE
jgi:uncharacterized protein